ncbi:hypothetical protein ACS0TY_016058 [Phlomoides rotata]
MSINHFSSDHLPEAHWWSHYTMDSPPPPPQTSSTSSHPSPHSFWLTPLHLYPSAAAPMNAAVSFDLNNDDDEETETPRGESEQQEQEIPKERLFEKPLTPSDVGKLNRLVIPKQHAEKHFPLNGGADSGELLGFEDEVGKSWRFRYSYWNSSQSYVLTKGWSRFVKEKRLDAGDIVIFARHRVDSGRLFIGWRRRNSAAGGQDSIGGWGRAFYSGQPGYQIQQQAAGPSNSGGRSSSGVQKQQQQQQQTTSSSGGSGNSKMVRLFGVNLAETVEDSSEPYNYQQQQQQYYSSSNHHMDISFSGGAGDVYRQG